MATSLKDLRLIWGADCDAKMERVVDHVDTLSPRAREVFNAGGVAEWLAVEALSGPAYRDAKNPKHEEANRRVSTFFKQVAGDDELIP